MARGLKFFLQMALSIGLIISLVMPPVGRAGVAKAAGEELIALQVDKPFAEAAGKKVRLDHQPFIRGNSTLVPVRFVAEQLGAGVSWEEASSMVVIRKGYTEIQLIIGSTQMMVNGEVQVLETPAELQNDAAFVPLRAIAEALGQEVLYDKGLILIGDTAVIGTYKIDFMKRYEIRERLKPDILYVSFNADPGKLDSATATTNGTFSVLNAISEGLYRYGPDGAIIPALAKELPTVSEDGLTYTIKLREGLQWSDGTRLTAHDFVYSYRRILDVETDSAYSVLLKEIRGAKALLHGNAADRQQLAKQLGVTAVDDHTLEIQFEHPVAILTQLLTMVVFYPVQEAAVMKYGSQYGTSVETFVGAGPFILTNWESQSRLVLQKNERYWDASHVYMDQVELQWVPNTDSTFALLAAGQLDVETNENAPLAVKNFEAVKSMESTNVFIEFQTQQVPAFANVKIRQALSMSIDREQLIKTALNPESEPAVGLIPFGTLDGNGGEFRKTAGDTQSEYNPEKAKQLLDEGLAELGLSELPVFQLMSANGTTGQQTISFVIGQWKSNLGITVEPEMVNSETRIDRQRSHHFDASVSLWGADYNDPMTFLDMFETGSVFNDVAYSSAEYDQLLQKARLETDLAARTQLLVQAEKRLMEDMPVTPLYYRNKIVNMTKRVEGIYFPVIGPEWELKNARFVQ